MHLHCKLFLCTLFIDNEMRILINHAWINYPCNLRLVPIVCKFLRIIKVFKDYQRICLGLALTYQIIAFTGLIKVCLSQYCMYRTKLLMTVPHIPIKGWRDQAKDIGWSFFIWASEDKLSEMEEVVSNTKVKMNNAIRILMSFNVTLKQAPPGHGSDWMPS